MLRREFLIRMSATAALAACGDIVSFTQPSTRPERVHIVPRMGDVIVDNKGQAYRLILNTKYPIPDLSRWLDYTKNKPTILRDTPEVSEALNKYATGEIPQEKTIFVLGDLKRNKPFGGDVNCFGAGVLTEDGAPKTNIIRPKDLFVKTKARLEKNGFTEMDSLFFPWGKKDTMTYSAYDTLDPEHAVDSFIEYTEMIIRFFPLCQQNWDFHSLAGVVGVLAFMKRPDLMAAVNNIFLESVPVRGLDPLRKTLFDIAMSQSNILRAFLGGEKFSKLLADLWNSPDHKKKVDEFGKSVHAAGKGLLNAGAKDDPFASEESREIEDAEKLNIIVRGFNPRDPLSYIDAHGAVLKDEVILERKAQIIGPNKVPLV